MLRFPKKGLAKFDQSDQTTFLSNLAVKRNASAFFEKYDRNEIQELLATAVISWLSGKEDVRSLIELPDGLMSHLKSVGFSTAIVLAPVDPNANLDYREVHQIVRELSIGIYCLNQIPSISLEFNYDQSSSCQLPSAYFDTRIGQILINVDYMIKSLWHGIYMPKDKRMRFSEMWRSLMDIDVEGKPQTDKDIFAEFCSAGLLDLTKDPDYEGIYDEDMNEDPTYDPNSPEEKSIFMKYIENIKLKLTFSNTLVQQYENVFLFEAASWLTNVIRYTDDFLDICTYQRLQQRLALQKKLIEKHLEKKYEMRQNMAYLRLICFMIPFLLALKRKMKVPNLNTLLPAFSDDKVKTERELPPFIRGQNFKCQHFHYAQNQYFHVHGGVEFDIGTPSVEEITEPFKDIYDYLQEITSEPVSNVGYKEYYPIPVIQHNGKSYYVISFDLEAFYLQLYKTQWWGAITEIMDGLRPKRLPLSDIQLHEQFKKKFGFKKAMKCKSLPYGMKCTVERGLYAAFHTFCRKTSSATINVIDDLGYSILHHASMHNKVPIICQLCSANVNVNQRRYVTSSQGRDAPKSDMKKDRTGITALHLAAQAGSLEATNCLLSHKADYTLYEKRGWMPIHFAAFYDNICIIIVLCRKDANLLEVETASEQRCTPLLLAATSGALDTLHYLFSHGANWRKTDSKGNNIIHLSVLNFHTEILKHIIVLNIPELPVWKTLVEMLVSDNYKRKMMAVMSLEVICLASENYWKCILDAGTIPALIHLLKSHKLQLKCKITGLLSNISTHRSVCHALVEAGGIPVLINLLHFDEPELQARSAVILYDVAQIEIYKRIIAKHAFHIPVKEQGATALWALAGQSLKQQKFMAEQIGYNFIIDMLLSPSAKMQYVGGEAVIALSKDSKVHQNQICEGNGIAPLVRLLRISKIAVGTLLSVIRAVGTICIGVAHTNNATSQQYIVDEQAFPVLIQLLRNHPSVQIKVEVACALACIVLKNNKLQDILQEKEGFRYDDVLYLLHSPEKEICLRAGYAITLFAFNNCYQQYLILESGAITLSIFEPFLNSEIETEQAMAAFQIIVLAKVIVDADHITLSARGITILVDLLYSCRTATLVLTGNLIASLTHTRAGLIEAFSTLRTIQRLCHHLYSEKEEVRISCACALGYLTYNAKAYRYLLKECRNKPNQFLRLMNNLSKDATICPDFVKEFQMQRKIGLPSLSLEINGGPSIIPVFKKGKEHRRKAKAKIQPKDSLLLIPHTGNLIGRLKASKFTTSRKIITFSTSDSTDIIKVSRPRIVTLSKLKIKQKKAAQDTQGNPYKPIQYENIG
uniref:Ankyrin and armadillo repeat containing n=1 Tax=Monodelphis domestica TaxID=13616 RepID=A0A5F8GIZ3_MONDO